MLSRTNSTVSSPLKTMRTTSRPSQTRASGHRRTRVRPSLLSVSLSLCLVPSLAHVVENRLGVDPTQTNWPRRARSGRTAASSSRPSTISPSPNGATRGVWKRYAPCERLPLGRPFTKSAHIRPSAFFPLLFACLAAPQLQHGEHRGRSHAAHEQQGVQRPPCPLAADGSAPQRPRPLAHPRQGGRLHERARHRPAHTPHGAVHAWLETLRRRLRSGFFLGHRVLRSSCGWSTRACCSRSAA